MFALGACAAAIAAGLGLNIFVQSLVFAVVSILALVLFRPAAQRVLRRGADKTPTGLDALIDQTATVLKRVDEDAGLIKIGGEEWSARSMNPQQLFEPGDKVFVVEIRGATAIVSTQMRGQSRG
ncbi:MAG: NfeD family protein [Corynebacteriales bacterium]|nr:NfeD family protein [Mycobacteriales bacterium]